MPAARSELGADASAPAVGRAAPGAGPVPAKPACLRGAPAARCPLQADAYLGLTDLSCAEPSKPLQADAAVVKNAVPCLGQLLAAFNHADWPSAVRPFNLLLG